jgi:branched-chain amino acid transport system permease protein
MAFRPSGVYDVTYEQDQAIIRTRVDKFWTILIALVLVGLPLFSSSGPFGVSFVSLRMIGIFITAGILLISVTGLNLLLGFTGQISLGQAAFMMVGAYTSAVLVRESNVPFLLALTIATLLSGLIGLVFGLASLRVKGFYLAMATLAAQFIIPWAIVNYRPANEIPIIKTPFQDLPLVGGTLASINLGHGDVLAVPSANWFGGGLVERLGDIYWLFGGLAQIIELSIPLSNRIAEYYLVLFFLILTATAARNLIRSRVGRAWISIRDNDLAAEQLGINVFYYKLLAFFVCALYEQLGMLVIGGAGFALGPTFGVAFFLFMDRVLVIELRNFFSEHLPKILTFIEPDNIPPAIPPLLFGVFLAVFLIYEPRGIAYRWAILQAAWRLRPFSKI